MHDLGDKIASLILAQSAKVSCAPWSGDGLEVNYRVSGIPEELFSRACVNTLEEAQKVIQKIGYPAMIKASEGGGGKGIRKCSNADELVTAFRSVQGEVPGSPIFLMKMLNDCRHLEVQVVGDCYGEATSVYMRDCSVQRRHQKIIEEGPPTIAPVEVWLEMENGAIRLTKEVGYVGAGTIEFLYHPPSKKFYFLEMNPRLQVEHPVTESIAGNR
jgi:biotin carboxylase